jgi:hypothetical protein
MNISHLVYKALITARFAGACRGQPCRCCGTPLAQAKWKPSRFYLTPPRTPYDTPYQLHFLLHFAFPSHSYQKPDALNLFPAMSITIDKILAASPNTERGRPTQLSSDPKGERIAYAVSIIDSADARIFTDLPPSQANPYSFAPSTTPQPASSMLNTQPQPL